MVWGDPLADHAQQAASVRPGLDRVSAAPVCRRLVYAARIADAAPRGAAFVRREVAALRGVAEQCEVAALLEVAGRREVVALRGVAGQCEVVALLEVAGLDGIACLRAAADQY